jgi:hypothetical protein
MFVELRLYGKKVLTIDHQSYVVNAAQTKDGQTGVEQARAQAVPAFNQHAAVVLGNLVVKSRCCQ